MGNSNCLGSWNVRQAVVLKPLNYPLWKSDEIDISDVGPPEEASSSSKRLEYKYVIRGPHGVKWEHGNNRWAPVDIGTRLTVHDGCFGCIQSYPFSFQEGPEILERSQTAAAEGQPRGWCIAVVGSSVAEGYNTWRKRGWAWLLGEALHQTYGHRVVNVSQCGANTAITKERLRSHAVTQLKPDIVIIALSLGNEGLAHCPAAERRAAQHRFEQGLLDMISMVLAMDAMPILGGVYPNNDYNAETYAMLKETARTMATWNVPIFEWLPVLDDGHGRWKESLYFDHAHPNTEGQRHMFECIDLSLFAHAGEDIPQLVRRRSSLSQLDSSERQTSYSYLDEAVQASQAAESTAHGEPIGPPAFEDGRGFSIVLCRGAISIRNKTEDEYVVSAEWQALSRALVAAGLRPGIYVSRDECCQNNRVLFVNHQGLMTKRLILPPSADALYLPSFQQGSGQDR